MTELCRWKTVCVITVCVKNKVPVEMHLYPKGGHGFGMVNKTTDDNWLERLKTG